MPRKLQIFFALCLFVGAGGPLRAESTERFDTDRPLRFCAGSLEGTYHRLAAAIRDELREQQSPVRLDVVRTRGSFDNALKMRDGSCQLALMQQDVAYLEYFNGQPFLALNQLYTEPIHVVAAGELKLRSLGELEERERKDREDVEGGDKPALRRPYRIPIGSDRSGSQAHALMLLGELDIEDKKQRLRMEKTSFADALQKIHDRQLDLAFVTTAVPSGRFDNSEYKGMVSLLAIDPDLVRSLRRRHPFLFPTEIPYPSYQDQLGTEQNVPTLGVHTLLVVHPELPDATVASLLKAVYALPAKKGAQKLPFLADLTQADGLSGVSVPVHEASRAYHREFEHWYTVSWSFLRRYGLALLILLAPLAVLYRLSQFAYFLHQFRFGRVLTALLAVWLLGAAVMYLVEGGRNNSFRSFGQTAVAMVHYLFSGLESKYPTTVAGEVTALLMLTLGAALVAIFSATLVSSLMEKMLYLERLRKKPFYRLKLKKHVVIAGWSDRTERIVRQLRSEDVQPKPTVVVLAPDAKEARFTPGERVQGVWLVEGEPSSASVLKRADVELARAVLVLDNDPRCPRSDLRTIATTLALESAAPRVRTIVEVARSSSAEHLDARPQREVVLTPALTDRMLSQALISPGVTTIFQELLTFGVNSQEVRFLPVPPKLAGKTFLEAAKSLLDQEVIPLGFRRVEDGEAVLHPRESTAPESDGGAGFQHRLRAASGEAVGDELVLLADDSEVLARQGRWRAKALNLPFLKPSRSATMSEIRSKNLPAAPVSKRPRRQELRIAICGWGEKARDILSQLQSRVVADHYRFVVKVLCDTDEAQFRKENHVDLHHDVSFVFGDPTQRGALKRIGIAEFDRLLILAKDGSESDRRYSDHRTLIIALAASELSERLHIVAEVLDSKNQEHFGRLSRVEVVSVEDISEKVLAQSVISPGISEVFLHLLNATDDTNEIYLVPVPDVWVGATFEQVYEAALEDDQAFLALGYQVYGDGDPAGDPPVLILNPRQTRTTRCGVTDWRGYRLREKDRLVVMAYEEPCWSGEEEAPAAEVA